MTPEHPVLKCEAKVGTIITEVMDLPDRQFFGHTLCPLKSVASVSQSVRPSRKFWHEVRGPLVKKSDRARFAGKNQKWGFWAFLVSPF